MKCWPVRWEENKDSVMCQKLREEAPQEGVNDSLSILVGTG